MVFGTTAGFPGAIEVSQLDGGNGFRIDGVSGLDRAGFAVHGAGDVNGDGIDDILIGAVNADPNGYASGAGYVVFGRSTGFTSTLQLAALDGSSGFAIQGQSANDNAGSSVGAAGDVNGDGIDDIIVGAPGSDANGYGSGASYVIFGSPRCHPLRRRCRHRSATACP